MEPQFEIHHTPTHAMLVENARKYGIGPRIPTVIICSVAFLGIIVFSVIAGIWNKIRTFAVVLFVLETVAFFLPHILIGIGRSILKKNNGGILPEWTITFADRIVCQEGDRKDEFAYADLIGAIRLKHSYKLRFTSRRTLLLAPEGFTKGTFEEFKQFLREIRPDLQIPE